jgi:cellulose synthase/poly-beta-1,6-N-acetylglucosamine synthase-like glycosyltransferase
MSVQQDDCLSLNNELKSINSTCGKLQQDLNTHLNDSSSRVPIRGSSSSSIKITNTNVNTTNSNTNFMFPNLSDIMSSSSSIEDIKGFPVYLLIFIIIIVNIFIAIILAPVISIGVLIIIYLILGLAMLLLYILSTSK